MLFSLSAFSRGIGSAAGCAAGGAAAAPAARLAFTASTIFLTAGAVVAPASATLPATFATFVIVSLFLEKFGDLLIDPLALSAGALRAFKGGNLVFEAPADESLFSLLTKRFVKTKKYAPQAIETFKKLIHLSGLPIHGRKLNEFLKSFNCLRGVLLGLYETHSTFWTSNSR